MNVASLTKKRPSWVKHAAAGCITAAVVGLAALLDAFAPLHGLEGNTWAWRVSAFAKSSASTDRIKIVLLDQASLDWAKNEMGIGWPWNREVYEPVIDFCRRGGARAVAFDVLFTEPSVHGVEDDGKLASAIGRSPAFALAAVVGGKSGGVTNWPEGFPRTKLVVKGWSDWVRSTPRASVRVAGRTVFPIPELARAATLYGNVNATPDRDGVNRRLAAASLFDGTPFFPLGLAAYLAGELDVEGGDARDLHITPGWFRIGLRRLPVDDEGRAILRFRGRTGVFETFSAAGVIQSELRLRENGKPSIDPAVFKDSYVFFGFSAPGLLDLRPTPLSPVMPGVELHATLLDNFLEQDALRDAPRPAVWTLALLLSALSSWLVVFSRKAGRTVLWFAVLLPLPLGAGFAGYAAGLWWPVVPTWIAVGLSLVSGVIYNYATVGRQKSVLKNAFQFYLGSEVIDQILSDPTRLKLGGERRELSIYFSDIEKFSSFSERLEPPVLTQLLNEFLTEMGAIIKEEGGYLDKYIGDAIVAFWNAPLEQPDHAARALRAALRCQRRLDELRPRFENDYGVTVRSRIGLNTGEVIVGNMGSLDRFNYTVLGDAANLASRLEGANKSFGLFLMASDTTWKAGGAGFAGREIARLRVVGRKTAVTVFEPGGLPGQPPPPWPVDFDRARALFYAGKFEAAAALFEKSPDDPPSRIYAVRCRSLAANPPAEWDGVWNLTEK